MYKEMPGICWELSREFFPSSIQPFYPPVLYPRPAQHHGIGDYCSLNTTCTWIFIGSLESLYELLQSYGIS